MPPPTDGNVAKNNNRLFSIYEAHLKMPGIKDYIDTATKLTAWLSDPKAYYAVARPKIVRLLITAQMTLRGAVGHSLEIHSPFLLNHYLHHPLAASYVGLIRSLLPFRDLFVEPELRDTVTQLLKSIEGANFPNMPTPTSISTSPTLQAPNPQHTWPTGSSNAVPSSGSPSVSRNKSSTVPEGQVANEQVDPTTSGAQGPTPPGELGASASVPPFGAQKSGKHSQKSPSPDIVFLGMSRNPSLARGASISTSQPNSSSNPTPNAASAPKNLGKLKGKRKKKVDITAFVQTDLQDFKQKHAQSQRQSLTSVHHIKKEPETEQMPPDVNAEHGGDAVDVTATVQSFVGQQPTQPPQGDARSPPSTLRVVTNFIETAPIPSVPVELPVPKAADSPSFAPPDTQDIKQPATQTEGPPPQVIRPLLISENSGLGQLFKWYEEYTSVENLSSQDSDMHEQRGEKEAPDNAGLAEDIAVLDCAAQDSNGPFHVIALTPGHAGDTNMEFTLDIAESTMDTISNWVKRSGLRLRDIKSSYCLSLGCYSSQDLMKHLRQNSEATADTTLTLNKAIASLPSAWPQNGGLTLNVRYGDSRKDVPIAPPLAVTGDGFVDVSEFVKHGPNSIIIHQRVMDFTDFTFVLHAHNPTFKQLQEIVELRKKEMEWKDWLADVTRPLETKFPRRALAPSMVV